jgi:HlyD family secretion protein
MLIVVALVAITGLSAGAYYVRRPEEAPQIVTGVVSRGPIVAAISASGTVEPVTTVQVGTQISGTVQALYADFNSVVKKGQVVARLDPSLVKAEIEKARATLVRAEAEVERLEVALQDAETKASRARELAARQLIAAADLEAADVAQQVAQAQVRSARAQVTEARASLSQAEVDLQKTVIAAPIDGIVIARNVDVGQTVAASLQASTLFSIAADLTQLQVKANIDESDLGAMQEGQPVTFTVDAYPEQPFSGRVKQVRLNPVVDQNVVTYAAIITARNPELKLRPGMTANVTIETARRDNALRLPSAALRFRPTEELLASLGQKNQSSTNQSASRDVNRVWLFDGGLHPATVRVGVSDSAFTEIIGGDVPEGARLALRAGAPASSPGASAPASSPLLAPPPRRF